MLWKYVKGDKDAGFVRECWFFDIVTCGVQGRDCSILVFVIALREEGD